MADVTRGVRIAHPRPLPAALTSQQRTLVMGIVNVTPDSFSDGGRWLDPVAAVRHGFDLVAQGADLLDIGGESTRPGAVRVSVDEELARVLPVVRGLAAAGIAVSIDTTRAEVAQEAVSAGAVIVNDVSGGLADPAIRGVVARTGVVYVAMHWRGHADVMEDHTRYDDVVLDVRAELGERLAELRRAGVRDEQVVLDPGLGFAKNSPDNWPLLAHLDSLGSFGLPVLIGASRKRFLGAVLTGADGVPVPPAERDAATIAVTALAAAAGAWCVRVHEVAGSADAVRVAAAWRTAAWTKPRASATTRGTSG
jgi:dihydropteroate synthase